MRFLKLHFFFKAMLICFAFSLNGAAPSNQKMDLGDLNPSTRLHPDSYDIYLFADLLVWSAKEAGADCWAEVIHNANMPYSNNIQEVDFGWDVGIRAGLGYGMLHDQWKTKVYYTYFDTRGKDSISSSPGAVHSTFLGNFYVYNTDGSGISGPSYQKATIDWKIDFNMFDWDLGRSFWASPSIALFPFIGIKGGWIDQSIHSKWINPELPPDRYFNYGVENLKNNFWGIGPKVGIEMKWALLRGTNDLYLFGDFSTALLWGHWSFYDRFKDDRGASVTSKVEDLNGSSSMFRSFMGLGWDITFDENGMRCSAKLGVEVQTWLDQLQFYSFTGGRLGNQLTLQGGTLEFCFNF